MYNGYLFGFAEQAGGQNNGIDFTTIDDTPIVGEILFNDHAAIHYYNNPSAIGEDPGDFIVSVAKEIADVATKFFDLGQALKIKNIDLKIIKGQYKDDPKGGLKAVVEAWLTGQYSVETFGKANWRMLAEAVADDFGGANLAVARAIRDNHAAQSS